MSVRLEDFLGEEYMSGYKAGLREAIIHAHWVEEYGDIKCSACSVTYSDEIVFMNRDYKGEPLKYCPSCGAFMDEEVDDE